MARVWVSVVDINDNRPVFYPVLYTVSLSTHSSPGTSVVKVTANDPDSGANGRVTYRTVQGGGSTYFTLNKDTGILTSASVHPVQINAHDGNGGLSYLSLSVFVGLPPQGLFLFPALFTAKPTRSSPW